MRNTSFLKIAALLLMAVSIGAFAQEMPKSVVGSGASSAQSGTMMLSATVGQHIIGISQNATQKDYAGFWYGAKSSLVSETPEVDVTPSSDSPISIAPHPVSSIATIQYTPSCEGMVRVELYSLVGNKIKTLYNDNAQGTLRLSFDARGLASGNYSLRISTPCGQSSALLIVKQ